MSLIGIYGKPLEEVKQRLIDALDSTHFFEDPERQRNFKNTIAYGDGVKSPPCMQTDQCQNLYGDYKRSCARNFENAYTRINRYDKRALEDFDAEMYNCALQRGKYSYDCCGGRIDRGHMAQIILADENRKGARSRIKLIPTFEEAEARGGRRVIRKLKQDVIMKKKLRDDLIRYGVLPLKKRILKAVTDERKLVTFMQFKTKKPVKYFGRVLRGRTEDDFKMLSPDMNRKLIMFMNAKGIKNLTGKSLKEILKTIGYSDSYANELIANGTRFKLLIAPKQDEILRGTWNNLLKLVKVQYAGTNIPKFLKRNLKALKTKSFNTIMKGVDMGVKMTAEKLNESEGSLWQVRKFLNDVLNLNELYIGDGYTYSEDGKRGLAEYFSLNKPVRELRDAKLIDLN